MKEKTIAIIGKNSTGKTRKLLFNEVDNEIVEGNNLLILDNKEEYFNHFKNKLEKENYKINVINLKNPTEGNGYDPLSYAKFLYDQGKIDEACEMIKSLALDIFSEQSMTADPFWENTAADYFTGIVLILLKISKETKEDIVHFGNISNAILQGEKEFNNTSILKTYCNNLNPMDPIYISLSSTLFAPDETRGSIISVVKQKLNVFFMRPTLLKSFYNNSFHIEDIVTKEEKNAIFVIGYEPIKRLTNIIINQTYDATTRYNKSMTFILEGIDELAPIINLEKMIDETSSHHLPIKLYTTVRSKNKFLSKYRNTNFDNVEKVINLTDKVELLVEEEKEELPKLNNKETEYFDFEEYVKKNFK